MVRTVPAPARRAQRSPADPQAWEGVVRSPRSTAIPSVRQRRQTRLLDYNACAPRSTERLGAVHLFGLGRRNHELTRRRCARDVDILMHAFPDERAERFDAFVAQVLMLVPSAIPPPP